MLPRTALAAGSWYDTDWGFRKEITIDAGQVAGNLSDFPVLISLATDAGLAAAAQADGDDILFTAADGTTKLSHEIESFGSGTGKLVAWVKVPALSDAADTALYMYYGNAAAADQQDAANVWDANFTLVQHLNEASGTEYDSTASNNDGTYTGSGQNATGVIDGADSFNGVNERVQINHAANLSFTGDYTVEAWVNLDTLPQWSRHVVSKNGEYFLQIHGDGTTGDIIFAVSGPGWLYSATPPTQGSWVHIAGVFNRGAYAWGPHVMQLYIDGSLDASASMSGTPGATTDDLYIGSSQTGSFLGGSIDEVRISNVARSGQWLQTSHANQSNPAAFYSLGAEETPAPAPVPPSVTSVGGTVYPVDKLGLLLPGLGLAAVLVLLAAAGGLCLRGARRDISVL
jgi:MSHA biogenesis protein MshQ